MMGSGAVYLTSLSGCERPSSVKLLKPATRIRTATPQFVRAHEYLRDGKPLGAPSRTVSADVIVVGGGLSGLTAAALLEKQGKHVLLVESESRIGGAAVSAGLARGHVALGSVYFVEKTEAVQTVLNIAGVQEQVCAEDGYVFDGVNVIRDVWSDAGIQSVAKDADDRSGMMRFRDDLIAMGDNVPSYPLPETLTPALAAYDGSALTYIRRYNAPTLERILESYARSAMGAHLADVNTYCLLNFYISEFGASFDTPRYTFPGGISVLSNGLAASLNDIRLDMLAVRVSQTTSGVVVDCIDEQGAAVRCTAGAVVIATPKFQIPYLLANCSTARATASRSLKYAPFATVHVVSDKPLLQADLFDTWHLDAKGYTDVINPNTVSGHTLSKHVASLYVPLELSDRKMLQDDTQFASRANNIVAEFSQSLSEEQQSSIRDVYCWGWGHGLVIPSPGSHTGIAQVARADDGRIVFANTDCDAAPAIENAIENGAIAARKALQAL